MSSKDRRKTPTPTRNASVPATSGEALKIIPDLIFEFDPDGIYVAIHRGRDEELLVPQKDAIGRHFSEILPKLVSKKLAAGIEECRTTKNPQTMSYLLPGDGDEDVQFFEARLLPMDSGNILAIVRDMTDTWREKTKLEQSESRYRTLVNNIPGIVYRCHIDNDWTAVFVSPEIEEMLGYPPQDFMSHRRCFSDITHPEDRHRVQREVLTAVEQGRPYHLSYRMIDADGEIRQITERGQAVYAEYDEITYLDGLFFDVTELHQMRQRVLVNSKMAAVGNLAAGVAHEINNPLAIAMANLEYVSEELVAVLKAVKADPSVTEALDDVSTAVVKIQGGIDRVRAIIDDLRTFSDAAEGRADQLDLKKLLDWAVRRSDGRLDENHQVIIDLNEVPTVWASEVGVVQVVWNLLDNAREAIARRHDDKGVIELALTHDEDHVFLMVRDNGPGMTPDVINRAFEPFFTTKAVGQGAGLGLFVCQGLVDGMDGDIEFESSTDEGTSVRVTLPAFQPTYPGQK